MEPVRSLREVLGGLAGAGQDADPERALREAGHGDLPDGLLSEAVASYADTAPVEVAEHLAPFVTAYRQGDEAAGAADPMAALDLLTSAPTPEADHPLAAEPAASLLDAEVAAAAKPDAPEPATDDAGLEFGAGDRSVELAPVSEPTDEPAAAGEPDAEPDPSFPALGEPDVDPYLWSQRPEQLEEPDGDEPDLDASA